MNEDAIRLQQADKYPDLGPALKRLKAQREKSVASDIEALQPCACAGEGYCRPGCCDEGE